MCKPAYHEHCEGAHETLLDELERFLVIIVHFGWWEEQTH